MRCPSASSCVHPQWAKAHYRLGSALTAVEEWSAAEESLVKAHELDSSNKQIKSALKAFRSSAATQLGQPAFCVAHSAIIASLSAQ